MYNECSVNVVRGEVSMKIPRKSPALTKGTVTLSVLIFLTKDMYNEFSINIIREEVSMKIPRSAQKKHSYRQFIMIFFR